MPFIPSSKRCLVSSHLFADAGVTLAEARDKLLVVRVLKHPEHVVIYEHLPIPKVNVKQDGGRVKVRKGHRRRLPRRSTADVFAG